MPFRRPSRSSYEDLFVTPGAADSSLSVTFLGVASLLFDDGDSSFMTDGFFSRPGVLRVASGRLTPDVRRIDAALARAAPSSVAGIIPVHTHYDHVLDTPTVAARTGAVLIGGTSAVNVARGHGLPDDQVRSVESGASLSVGAYDLSLRSTGHCPPDRYPGQIRSPIPRTAPTKAYRCGEAWSIHVTHRPTARTALVQGSAGYTAGSLVDWTADVVYLGVGQLGRRDPAYVEQYWTETVVAVGARRAVLIHWDNFFRPLDRPLRPFPHPADDFDVTLTSLRRLAVRDGVELCLPTLWSREDPWA